MGGGQERKGKEKKKKREGKERKDKKKKKKERTKTNLVNGASQTISNANRNQRNVNVGRILVSNSNSISQRRNIMTSITLTKNKKRTTNVLRESLQPPLQESVHISSHLLLIMNISSTRTRGREASTSRLIDEDDVGVEVPGVGVGDNSDATIAIIGELEGTVFVEDGQFAGGKG